MIPTFVSRLFVIATALALLVCLTPQADATLNNMLVSPANSPYELVIVELEGCTYCEVLRRDVMPAYLVSPEAKDLPVRFLDLNTAAADKLELTEGPLTMVPTVLLVKGNREVGRAPGYMGPEGFFQAIRWMMSHAP
jgi:thioredoxin-related protein